MTQLKRSMKSRAILLICSVDRMPRKKLSRSECRRNYKEEKKSAKYYRSIGRKGLARDEERHARVFKKCM